VAAHLIKRKNPSKRLTQVNIFCSFLRACSPGWQRHGQFSCRHLDRRAEAEIQGLARKLNLLGEKIGNVEEMVREKLARE
jgi:hypothetical protein